MPLDWRLVAAVLRSCAAATASVAGSILPASPDLNCEDSEGFSARTALISDVYAAFVICKAPLTVLPLGAAIFWQPLSNTHVAAIAEAFTPKTCKLANATAPHG